MSVLSLLFVWRMVPETKVKNLGKEKVITLSEDIKEGLQLSG